MSFGLIYIPALMAAAALGWFGIGYLIDRGNRRR